MIPRIIHFTTPRTIGPQQERAIQVARELHPDWEIRVWQDPVHPDGFRLAHYWPLANSGAQLADLIRIEVVHRYGGVYLDSDVVLRKRLDDLVERSEFLIASEDGLRATNAVFGARQEHPALEHMIQELLAAPPDWADPPTVTTGPEFFSHILKWRKDITVLPRETFYPYNWNEKPAAVRPHTYGVHRWEGSWKHGSALGQVKKLFSPGAPERVARIAYRACMNWYRSNEYAIRLLSPRVPAYSATGNIVRRTIHGHSVILDANDVSITPEVVRTGYYELSEEIFLRKCLKGGDYFVDVGANFGLFTLLAASLVGPFGRVFAYEPNPLVAQVLRKSAAMNWMHERIVLREVAVGTQANVAQLQFSPARLGDAAIATEAVARSALGSATAHIQGVQSVSVSIVALDDEFPCDIPIKLLKIDAEGYEPEVLAGAARLLESHCVEYIMLEAVKEVAGDAWPALIESLTRVCKLGYETYTIGRNGRLLPVTIAHLTHKLQTRNLVLKSADVQGTERRERP